jgi:hypothetical protein
MNATTSSPIIDEGTKTIKIDIQFIQGDKEKNHDSQITPIAL